MWSPHCHCGESGRFEADYPRQNNEIMRLENLRELHWLAGLLEGEGSFMNDPPSRPNNPIVSIEMTDEDIIKKVSKIFERKYQECKRKNKKYKKSFKVILTGYKSLVLMIMLYPLMSQRRRKKIKEILKTYDYTANYERIKKQADRNRKLTNENILLALKNEEKLSLRERARRLKVHHETLRRVLKIRQRDHS